MEGEDKGYLAGKVRKRTFKSSHNESSAQETESQGAIRHKLVVLAKFKFG
jgi:hypothetical protein